MSCEDLKLFELNVEQISADRREAAKQVAFAFGIVDFHRARFKQNHGHQDRINSAWCPEPTTTSRRI